MALDKTISKSKLKAKMLEIFRELEANGGELIVTNHGAPALRITPIPEKYSVSELFADVQGRVIYREDIDSPSIREWGEV